MKDYHETKRPFGYSDIARLTAVGPREANFIEFGRDGGYCAYVIDESYQIPDHYTLHSMYKHWLTIFDDDSKVDEFKAEIIKVFRSGMSGLIIQLINKYQPPTLPTPLYYVIESYKGQEQIIFAGSKKECSDIKDMRRKTIFKKDDSGLHDVYIIEESKYKEFL